MDVHAKGSPEPPRGGSQSEHTEAWFLTRDHYELEAIIRTLSTDDNEFECGN